MLPDVYPQPIFGPSLMIAGRSAAWNGSTNNRVGEIGLSCRVLLEARVKERVVSTLDVQNNGTAAIYYSWMVKSPIITIMHRVVILPVELCYLENARETEKSSRSKR
jgi:hypothetical protein